MYSQSTGTPPSMLHWTGKDSLGIKAKVNVCPVISCVPKYIIISYDSLYIKMFRILACLPIIPEISTASTSISTVPEFVTITCPVALLVALTVTVCGPLATPEYWKPDVPIQV